MKKVLAELHELINDLEDQGLTAEASSLQEVFVRVAQEADLNDLSEKVTDLLGKYSAPELIAALAEQIDSKDTKTMSFAFGDEQAGYGNEPKDVIINEFVDQAKNKDMRQDDAYFMMNQRLQFNGHPSLTKQEFDAKVNSSGTNVSEFAFGDEPDSGASEASGVDEETERQNIILSWRKHVEKGNMSRGSAARMATQQLRMKFPNAKLITETEIVPLKFPDNGGRFGVEPGVAEQDGLNPTNSNHPIVKEYVDKASRYKMDKEEAYAEMNEKLKAIGQRPYVRSSFDIDVYNHTRMIKTIGYQGPGGPFDPRPVLDRYLDETGKEMSERHKKFPYSSPMPQSSR
jgi:hypothetical protein